MFYLGVGEGPGPCARGIAKALLPYAEARIDTHGAQGCLAVSAIPRAWGSARRHMRVCQEDGMVACAWARIDNGRDIARALGDVSGTLAQDAPLLIIRAYRKWGEEAPRHLEGDFAFAIHDPRNRSVFAARDPVGIRPLYWMQGETAGSGACATSIPALRHAARLSPDVDPSWVARFLASASMSCEATPFTGILKVPPGHSLRIADNGARISRYCNLADEALESDERDTDLLERYRELLDRATAARLAEHESHGIEISGGLDSSTVLAFALRSEERSECQLHGFGWARQELEGAAIIGVSQRLGLARNHLLCGQTEAIPRERIWSILGHPAEHGSAVHQSPIYRLAERLGVTGLLSGFGGDEGVTNYAPNFAREMMDRREYRALWQALGTNPLVRTRKFVRIMLGRDSRSNYSRRLLDSAHKRIAALPLASDIMARLEIGEQLKRDAQFDHPYPTVRAFSASMISRPFVSTRTESCSLIAANSSVEYAWPLLDRPLLSCFLKAPTTMYFQNGMGRALHRSAVAGIVPDDRRLAPTKFMGDQVEPTHRFRAQVDIDQPRDMPDWTRLEPMLQELVDRESLSNLTRQVAAASGKVFPARRMLLYKLAEINEWVANGQTMKDAAP